MAKWHYLTDAKTWVSYWCGEEWVSPSKERTATLLKAIKNHEIAIYWRSRRVAEFSLVGPPWLDATS